MKLETGVEIKHLYIWYLVCLQYNFLEIFLRATSIVENKGLILVVRGRIKWEFYLDMIYTLMSQIRQPRGREVAELWM